MKNLLWLFLITLASLTGCKKVNIYPNPALETGQCEYAERGFTDIKEAVIEMNRVKEILTSSTIGEGKVVVINHSTFVAEDRINKKGKIYDKIFGFQIVFSCNQAEIKYYSERGFESRAFADNAYLYWKSNTPAAKVIDAYTEYYENCWTDSGHDYDGDGFADPGSTTTTCDITDYYFAVLYAVVNNDNVVQRQILTGLQFLDAIGVKPRAALRVAADYIPMDLASKKELQDWNLILKRIQHK